LDPSETLSVSSGSKLFTYGTLVVLGGLRVNQLYAGVQNSSFDKVFGASLRNVILGNIFENSIALEANRL